MHVTNCCSALVGERSIVKSTSVRVSVCPSVHTVTRLSPEPRDRIHQFLCMSPVAVARSNALSTSDFVDDVMFTHNGQYKERKEGQSIYIAPLYHK